MCCRCGDAGTSEKMPDFWTSCERGVLGPDTLGQQDRHAARPSDFWLILNVNGFLCLEVHNF